MGGPGILPKRIFENRGFTLVEIIVVLFIMAVVSTAVYKLFAQQQRTYTTQDMVVEMQQNVRAAVDMMIRELRMAGYDPDYNRPSRPANSVGIEEAKNQKVRFTYVDAGGTGVEDITYELYTEELVPGGPIQKIGRTSGGGVRTAILEHVLDFNLEYMIIADGSFRGLGRGKDDGDPAGGNPDGRQDEPGELIRIDMRNTAEKDLCPQAFCKDQCDNCKIGLRVVRITLQTQTPYQDLNSPTGGRPTYRLVTDVAMRNLSYIR